jgi:23S rRNA (cytidine1920-2'-O)/16S rRNA (cytidine1409-2'-O)-methyltransferase
MSASGVVPRDPRGGLSELVYLADVMARDGDPSRARRLDVAMVERGLAPSRARACSLIRQGLVEVAGAPSTRPAMRVAPGAAIGVRPDAPRFVSRGALKLAAALDHFRLPVAGVIALDVGASTGGFTELLLLRGAARVYAVDVGHGQLAARLGRDRRVVALEGCDARRLDRRLIAEEVGAVVADVSFISLAKALPVPLTLAAARAWLIALIKPQFEVGRAAIGKRGIVRDAAARQRAVDEVCGFIGAQAGWRVLGVIPSPLRGGSGNAEYLVGAVRGG